VSHVLFTGGGTAGHVVPTFEVIRALQRRGVHVSFVGSNSGLEQQLLASLDVDYYGIASGKLRRYASLANLRDGFRVLAGIWQAFWLLGRLRPDVVFSKGGFVSFPVVLAAWLRGVPVIAHESDLTPGLANRLAMPFAKSLCINFAATPTGKFRGHVVHTGTPLRDALTNADAAKGRELLAVGKADRILLITGGSLGADALNAAVRNALEALTEKFVVVHVCGPGKLSAHSARRYRQFEYVTDDWGDILAAADLVVSRAGANTLYELLALRKPNLLVPLSRRASRGDQIENATFAAGLGYSHVLDEDQLDAGSLVAAVEALDAQLSKARERLTTFTPPDSVALICAELDRYLSVAT
jgi:UDP-N-acetylglucosamine--N-acetylmuramyl-(pentapeptide) pyrophosphoryl-undecaprenol N-acetylglucosamine transferase